MLLDELALHELVDQRGLPHVCVANHHHLYEVASSSQVFCAQIRARGVCVSVGRSISEELAGAAALVLFEFGVFRPMRVLSHFGLFFG